MSLSSYLWSCRDSCLQEIDDLQDEINEITAKRDSLELFKTSVSTSQESFQSLNAQAQTVLANLDPIKENCLTAEKYAEGMNDTLSGFGTGVVDLAFSGLLLSIGAKLAEYWLAIETKQLEQGALRLKAESLYWEALAAEAAEEAAAAAAEGIKDLVT